MKKDNKPMIVAVIALILAVIAVANSFNTGMITGHATSQTDIVYNDGFVGIGVLHPDEKFHVGDGDALFEDNVVIEDNLNVQDDLVVGGVADFDNISTMYLYVNGTAISGATSGGIDHSGDVAIGGNLDVGGDISAGSISADALQLLISDTLPTCGVGDNGLLYLDNSTPPVLALCYESGWLEVGF